MQPPARFPSERHRSSGKERRQVRFVERIEIAEVRRTLRRSAKWRKGIGIMSFHVLARPEGRLSKNAKGLLDLLWGATLALSFAFAVSLALTLAVSLAAHADLIKIPDRICSPDMPTGSGPQICS
jgi:hypothetical protein